MRTITLELLRHGPAHNQLLSPLTQYLALCENHSAVTVQVPFEHNQMLYRLRALSYLMGREPRQFQVHDTAQVLGELLAKVPGLTADMNRSSTGAGEERITHLRLVLSASELALLPFELAVSPAGFPGAGQPLLLQPHTPVCITRETRRVPEQFGEWPRQPKVLVVTASPAGYEPVPAGAHLLALRRILEPWIGASDADNREKRRQRVVRHLTLLSHASVEDIERACESDYYTHVHILAHGHEHTDGYDVRFGLALHDPADPLGREDIVSGERLATALRVANQDEAGQMTRPAVVTLATCHGGNMGTVAGVGASIAHALHAAGIPMVVASQFPLSFGGSVRMVEVLYHGLLWGEDPRKLLVDLRRQLHTEFPQTHDWASITAYSSLPVDFDRKLAAVQIHRSMSNINVALSFADDVTKRFSSRFGRKTSSASSNAPQADNDQLLALAKVRVREAKNRLQKLLTRHPAEGARIRGLLASTEKREAEILYQRSKSAPLTDAERAQAKEDAMLSLERARNLYWEAFVADRKGYWAVVQFLSLTLVLERSGRLVPSAPLPSQSPGALWDLAEVQSLGDLEKCGQSEREWALGNLIELYIIAPMVPAIATRHPPDFLRTMVETRTKELAAAAGATSFEAFSTRRQVIRYLEWYQEMSALPAEVIAVAEIAIRWLPERDEPEGGY